MNRSRRQIGFVCGLVLGLAGPLCAGERAFVELKRFPAIEAHQGVAVDANHFYAITNRAIGKYDKRTGDLVKRWESSDEYRLEHLNAGVVLDGRLYAAHSNYPAHPNTSSVEIWNAETLEHVDHHSFGITDGSLTWVDRHDGSWWAVFAHYAKKSDTDVQNRGTRWTSLVRMDDQWRRLEAWEFPAEVVARFEPSSNSGGGWGPDGLLYTSGHDAPELYALRLPRAASTLELVDTLPINNTGQAFAWDPSEPGVIYAIHRLQRQVVVSRLE